MIQAGREFRVLGKNPLDEFTLATPAIADGSLFIRTATKLYRIASVDLPEQSRNPRVVKPAEHR